jgi:hypothetical protein
LLAYFKIYKIFFQTIKIIPIKNILFSKINKKYINRKIIIMKKKLK